MDINKILEEIKKTYQAEPSQDFLEHGWQNLQSKMSSLEQAQAKKSFFYFRPFVFAVLVLFILTGVLGTVVQASQKALPGEALYPVKRLSEDVASKVTGNSVIKVEGRAQEIVELSKEGRSLEEVQKAVEEYKIAVSEASRSGKNEQEIEEKLEEHEKEFEEIKKGPSEKEIDEAIKISKSGRGGGDAKSREDKEDEDKDSSGTNSGGDSD